MPDKANVDVPLSKWAVEIDGKQVRLDDMSFSFWEGVSKRLLDTKVDGATYGTVLLYPMQFPEIGHDICVEAARLLGNADPAGKIAELCTSPYGEVSQRKLDGLIVPAEDDLPTQT